MGFGIVVVDAEGSLKAWGNGRPPPWIHDAAGAEAWALTVVLEMCPSPPYIITDCLGLLTGAALGPARLMKSNSKLARTWGHIVRALDG